MNPSNQLSNEKKEANKVESKDVFKNLRSNYILKKVFYNLLKKKSLDIIKYNNNIKERMNINVEDYKECSGLIEIEIKPIKNESGKFININENKVYYHIYFNENKEEIKRNYFNKYDNVSKIKIIIDYQVKSFDQLFYYCECIEYIYFKNFYRNNINNMQYMFYGCTSLKELNLSNFNTNNVTNMSCMFYGCSSLKELNLSNFNTNNVTDMFSMFYKCTEQLKNKIKSEYKNIKEEAFL